ncbi:desulfoferrodoxin [candidate division WS6 bacterium RIFOXYD1_FULL_33_8]|uniref:Desulfoferrodoxin n=2 Tax=Candidatus Dojkabacteria TaxID=74243 RepID=A0A0G0ASN6_9BACT|nr:MAG: desulfoferrodoxin, superoxide reductase [candidate division WS6 bacterium GW2011_GWE2_33_157]KKP43865.1 MAG: desulfoferrodoxin, superoxide reductase [candidate division WS6 bacterium GW2011_GWC1_33_20]KKP44344.1 MAG: desulfoferrodoxin, superoxide reductase [candidate division WS6 bacterium GW2011_GWF1_33_233]KKP54421.1 MAG: Desulfoferrodoxin [candidate division WS6 bacterium GW2011_GWB1_33_6]KKP54830.1 MAG: desulfoferrodoxin, superoxide reductase [candidate division WS6 bacterium GW2011
MGKIYKCEVCGHIIEILHEGTGTLVCCNKDMVELIEKKEDVGLEKHVPVIEIIDYIAKISIGEILHPMEETHYIEFVQLIVDGVEYTKFLKPGETPIVEFQLPKQYTTVQAREYCNVHGLWISK